jgi:hypothetical protein
LKSKVNVLLARQEFASFPVSGVGANEQVLHLRPQGSDSVAGSRGFPAGVEYVH